ncbi:hypothetical protein MMC30_008969 [Trapelia coarctata]|nr:hypothetical protein [Trapelia coarctata]
MDAHYTNGTIYQPNNRQTFPSLPNIHSQFQQASQPSSHTLPPLQPQRAALGYTNDIFGQSLRPPPPPLVPTQDIQYNDYVAQGQPRHMLPQASYLQPVQHITNLPSYVPQSSQVPATKQLHFPDIRPMPVSGINQPSILSSNFGSAPTFSPNNPTQDRDESPRTHVVGSQGRRGILPSAAGRPAAVPVEGNSSSAKSAIVPTKDADGKFPCPHCNKTYLHAKHLKRHLLRHTGDRPYSCILCSDTFSRSDILKRHFQKCSIRRGNPTGATHLSNSQSHLKKQGARKLLISDASEANSLTISPTAISTHTSFDNINGLGLDIDGFPGGYQSASLPVSRSGSVKKATNGTLVRDKRSMTGPVPPAFKRASLTATPTHPDSTSLPSSSASTPLLIRSNRQSGQFPYSIAADQTNPGAYSYNSEMASASSSRVRNSLPLVSGPSVFPGNGFDWTSFPNDTKQSYPNLNLPDPQQNNHLRVKPELEDSKLFISGTTGNHNDEILSGLFGAPSTTGGAAQDSFQHWTFHPTQLDAFQLKAQQLISFCLADGSGMTASSDEENQLLRYWLTSENIEHFLECYSNFQGHWPVIHMPTFNPMNTYDGLVLAMICIGAVYSNRIDLYHARLLLSRAKVALEGSSQVFAYVRGSPIDPDLVDQRSSNCLEEFQALVLLSTLSIWHGDPVQRQNARDGFQHLVKLARHFRMLQPSGMGSSSYSQLHQPSNISEQVTPETWDWLSWVRQEKKIRLMYTIFLVDAALTLYFNCQPHFEPMEIRLPLPADDASWEGVSSRSCALALGLYGAAAQEVNVTGSRRTKQPEFHLTMQALFRPTYELLPRTTNAFSKFILIHGLHLQIWEVQKQISHDNALYGINELGFFGNGSNTPMSQYDWIAMSNLSARTSNNNSGQATPTDSSGAQSPAMHQQLKATTAALAKWKKIWDEDLPLQYPPEAKRVGFCRDGIHFYWLAQMILRKNRASDWQMPPDSRMMQIMALLKQAKMYVASQNTMRGEESGSVGDIDEQYGVADLTLDMKQLFTPLTPDHRSPTSGMQSGISGNLI